VAGDQPVLAGAGAGVPRDENKTEDDEPENKTEDDEPEIPFVQAQPVHPDHPGLAGLAMAVGVPIQVPDMDGEVVTLWISGRKL
jgi:hypothetical protein